MLEEGQTVLVKTASVGKSAYVKELPEKATINPQIVVLKPQKIEPKFLAYSIFHNYVQVQIKGAVGAGAIPNMSQDSISKFDILLPPDKKGIEQQKIAACLSSLDELIAAHNDKLDALKDHKKGLLQNLFPQEGETVPKIRFPEFEGDGEWVEDKLSNCADVVDPHPSHRAPIAVSDGIPFIGIGDISEQGELNLKNVRLVPREILDEHRERYRLKIGDFAYGRVASVGKVVDLSKNIDKDYTYSPTMAIVQPKRINASFLRHLCNSSSFITQVIAKTSGSTRKSIGMQNLRILNISMPSSLEEQQKIRSVGKVVDLSKNIDKDYTYSPTMAIVQPKRINASFLRHLCNSSSFITQVIAKTSGSTRKSIGMQNLRILNISMPSSLEEQQKIASCLSAVDELITAQQEKIDELQQHKKGLMQGLFPKMTD